MEPEFTRCFNHLKIAFRSRILRAPSVVNSGKTGLKQMWQSGYPALIETGSLDYAFCPAGKRIKILLKCKKPVFVCKIGRLSYTERFFAAGINIFKCLFAVTPKPIALGCGIQVRYRIYQTGRPCPRKIVG